MKALRKARKQAKVMLDIARRLGRETLAPGVSKERRLDVLTGAAASVVRLAAGLAVRGSGTRPAQPLVIYEFEACPFCRKVREALSELDLEADIRPCPKGGQRFRPEVQARGGKQQFPYLVDPNTGVEMYESDAIVAYLYERYGRGRPPMWRNGGTVMKAGMKGFTALRGRKGADVRPSRAPEQQLELWSYEASPFSRIVRERLSELELPYRLHNVARGSKARRAFIEMSGKMQVPFLVDPNTGVRMFESAEIVAYLDRTYALPAERDEPEAQTA